jgi:hypothetical protein
MVNTVGLPCPPATRLRIGKIGKGPEQFYLLCALYQHHPKFRADADVWLKPQFQQQLAQGKYRAADYRKFGVKLNKNIIIQHGFNGPEFKNCGTEHCLRHTNEFTPSKMEDIVFRCTLHTADQGFVHVVVEPKQTLLRQSCKLCREKLDAAKTRPSKRVKKANNVPNVQLTTNSVNLLEQPAEIAPVPISPAPPAEISHHATKDQKEIHFCPQVLPTLNDDLSSEPTMVLPEENNDVILNFDVFDDDDVFEFDTESSGMHSSSRTASTSLSWETPRGDKEDAQEWNCVGLDGLGGVKRDARMTWGSDVDDNERDNFMDFQLSGSSNGSIIGSFCSAESCTSLLSLPSLMSRVTESLSNISFGDFKFMSSESGSFTDLVPTSGEGSNEAQKSSSPKRNGLLGKVNSLRGLARGRSGVRRRCKRKKGAAGDLHLNDFQDLVSTLSSDVAFGIPDHEEVERLRNRNSSIDVQESNNIVVRDALTGEIHDGSDLTANCTTFVQQPLPSLNSAIEKDPGYNFCRERL